MRLARELNTAVSIPLPPTRRSFPKPPLSVSLLAPPLSVLADLLPVMMSLPAPPFTFSIPIKISLPSRVFCLPVEPKFIRLFLELKTAVSIPAPPTRRSFPNPP